MAIIIIIIIMIIMYSACAATRVVFHKVMRPCLGVD